MRELGEAIAKGNRELYDMTVLYCAKDAEKDEVEQFSCQLMRSESRNQILETEGGSKFAKELNLKPGHFYAYYKPSALNTDLGVMSLEVNASLL